MRQPAGSELNSPLRGAGSAPCGPTAAMGHPWHCAPQCPACPVLLLTIVGDAQRRACSDPGPSWSSAAPHSHRCTKSKQGMAGGKGGVWGEQCCRGLLGEIGQQVRAAPKAAEGFHVVWMEEAKPRAALANGHMESPEKLRRGTDVHGAALQRAALCIGRYIHRADLWGSSVHRTAVPPPPLTCPAPEAPQCKAALHQLPPPFGF